MKLRLLIRDTHLLKFNSKNISTYIFLVFGQPNKTSDIIKLSRNYLLPNELTGIGTRARFL